MLFDETIDPKIRLGLACLLGAIILLGLLVIKLKHLIDELTRQMHTVDFVLVSIISDLGIKIDGVHIEYLDSDDADTAETN